MKIRGITLSYQLKPNYELEDYHLVYRRFAASCGSSHERVWYDCIVYSRR